MTRKINRRLDDLERAAGGPEVWRSFWQDNDDPNIYHDTPARRDDKTFTREEVDAMNCNKFRVVCVDYVEGWIAPPIDDDLGDRLNGE
jgi:hypothetical protein